MCQACCWRRQGRIQRTCFGWVALAGAIEALTKGKGTGKGNAEGDPARKWRIRRAMGKAESGSTGIVTTVELTVTERPKQALGCRNGRTGQGEAAKANERERETRLYSARAREEEEEEERQIGSSRQSGVRATGRVQLTMRGGLVR